MIESSFNFEFPVDLNATVGETGASVGKSSLKDAKSFQTISSNQKLARALTSSPLAIA